MVGHNRLTMIMMSGCIFGFQTLLRNRPNIKAQNASPSNVSFGMRLAADSVATESTGDAAARAKLQNGHVSFARLRW